MQNKECNYCGSQFSINNFGRGHVSRKRCYSCSNKKCRECGRKITLCKPERKTELCKKCSNFSRRFPIEERFWKYVKKTDSCWIWQAGINNKGYGYTGIGRKHYLSHRISWELFNGQITNNLHVLHKCDNPPCVNPDHLWLGTQKDNAMDREAKGRSNYPHLGRPKGIPDKTVKIIKKLYKPGTFGYRCVGKIVNLPHTTIKFVIEHY